MFLGVDGGGTKTAFCLVTADGDVAAQVQGPSTDYFSVGIDLVGRVLRDGVAEVCAEAGITSGNVRHAFFGLPTYGEASGDVPVLNAAARDALGHDRYACGNDTVCSWAGSLGGEDGINIVSGTGSITYGEHDGRGVRVGGWGELFGDEGSAYWIAVRGLGCFSRMSDGRLPAGPLHTLIREHLDLNDDLDLVDVVLNRWHGNRSKIAALGRLVVTAAGQGDRRCGDILAEAARELAETVDTTRTQLGFRPGQPVPVSYSGGVFKAGPLILDAFRSELDKRYAAYELRDPLFPPDIGAAIYAARSSSAPLSPDALQRLQSASSPS
ncbi:N-acetylglucosamine kinase [Actinomadura darangshiensis]|uniref:N-acetylglucosamine kinase n=1 Tax=Actinomadura darangshiensis TaxID=705336 RepID=A0A4R5BJP3_9ACTN|nr:BadF/BadG/BcrA/BcrD ATPase family protein [Actinomadura darangshiensis]TDD86861.1 N-acetylglucosamine kinase [Actinomadura darangshiensis]